MNITYFLTILVSGLKLGSIYAIVAIGYSIVYGILRLINFAHGDIMTIGVYLILVFMNTMGLPLFVCVLLSVALSVGVGLLIERLAYRPLRDATEETTLISSLAVSALLQNVLQIIFSAQRKPFLLPKSISTPMQVGMFKLSVINIATYVVTAVFLVLLYALLKKTKIGAAMRACSENMRAARLMGVNVNRVVMFAFFIGSAMAVVAGLLLAGEYKTVYPSLGFVPGLKAFCAAVVGGIGSLGGAVTGAFVIGVAEILFQGLMPTTMTAYRDAFVFLLMVAVLLLRPNGLFGKNEGGRS
ncbi:MAG: branched-chain amino acid ABC transporter permease [Lachnospiraceae bacterium]|jgi:branched-chain amino acid transport system permease protein|nr:branched-chain amino acid ABC transporter permease [Lachnospiraceae bacterium]